MKLATFYKNTLIFTPVVSCLFYKETWTLKMQLEINATKSVEKVIYCKISVEKKRRQLAIFNFTLKSQKVELTSVGSDIYLIQVFKASFVSISISSTRLTSIKHSVLCKTLHRECTKQVKRKGTIYKQEWNRYKKTRATGNRSFVYY